MKDLRVQGIALAVKWLAKPTEGEEPWKILIRHNLSRGYPSGAKFWSDWNILDFLALDCKARTVGSTIFKTIWKSWGHVRPLLGIIQRVERGNI